MRFKKFINFLSVSLMVGYSVWAFAQTPTTTNTTPMTTNTAPTTTTGGSAAGSSIDPYTNQSAAGANGVPNGQITTVNPMNSAYDTRTSSEIDPLTGRQRALGTVSGTGTTAPPRY